MGGMRCKDKEMFLWSFCVVIATKIKYLELNTMIVSAEECNLKSSTQDRRFIYRQLQTMIQKFVLELSEPSASRNLWPWHDNCLNDTEYDMNALDERLHYNGEYKLEFYDAEDMIFPPPVKLFNYANIRYVRKC